MSPRVAVEGSTCWRVAPAPRVAFLVDGADYFAAVASACEKARESIFIAGWAIDSRIRLRRDGPSSGSESGSGSASTSDEMGSFLASLARRHRSLHVRVLAWDFALLFGLESGFLPIFRTSAADGRRVQWELDSEHALGAAQHQKIVVVDDRVAFVSGMDLTSGRWDTRAHAPSDPLREDSGRPHGPHHDLAVVFDGPPAAHLGELMRARWNRATGRAIPLARLRASVRALQPGTRLGNAIDRAGELAGRAHDRARHGLRRLRPPLEAPGDPWPDGVEPVLRDASVGLARTEAAYLWTTEIREVEALWVAAIAAARSCVYIENQYFTSKLLTDALAARLAEPSGPEVVILQPLSCAGWLEQATMGVLRGTALDALARADVHGRFRVFHPVDADGQPVYVHAKVLIVDDDLVRVGSANASNRSLSLDTEIDAVVEAEGRADARAAIAAFRDGLVAEHLGVDAARVQAEMRARGSLGAAVDALRGDGRSLRPLATAAAPWLSALIPTGLADPERTERADALPSEVAPPPGGRPTRGHVARASILIASLAFLTIAWNLALFGIGEGARTLAELAEPWAGNPLAPVVAALGFVLLGVVAFPMSVLVLAAHLAFGPFVGTGVSLVGGMASSLLGYVQGHVLGRRWTRRLGGERVNRVSRALAHHGVVAVAAARLMPFVPWTLTSVLAGASHVRPLDYVVGTLVGLVPGVLAVALLADAATKTGLRLMVELVLFAALLLGAFVWARATLRRTSGG